MPKPILYGIIGTVINLVLTAVITYLTGFNPLVVFCTLLLILGILEILIPFDDKEDK